MTAGKVESAEGLPIDAVSGVATTGKTSPDLSTTPGLGAVDETPGTPPITGTSASDGPGIIHRKHSWFHGTS